MDSILNRSTSPSNSINSNENLPQSLPTNPLSVLTSPSRGKKKGRLERTERLQSESNIPAYSTWESLVRESFGHIAWPIKITSWELVDDKIEIVPQSSSATELISRRGVFSRRHYGSVDKLAQSELDIESHSRKFRVENGESVAEKDEVFGSPSTPIVENPEHQTRWYFKYFLGKLHQNYFGIDGDKNPYFLSVVSHDSSGNQVYRAILFKKQGTQKIAIPFNINQKLTVKQILNHFPGMDSNIKNPKEIFSADIQKDLLLLEEQEGSVNFKFGVIYMMAGQTSDDDMLSNELCNDDFNEFLSILGEKIRLKNWERFKGGLDIKGDMTGKYSIYTLYEGHEIMYHVSTLLPFSKDNRQQVERKRHIGNDIVNIIFVDTTNNENYLPTDFDPNCIKSQFTHIFAVIIKKFNCYRLALFCDETVPPFGPTLPNPPEFTDLSMFREFLLVKLINAEKATFQTPTFSKKRERTLEMLIKDLYEEYSHDSKFNMLNRRAFSEVLYDAPKTKIKEDARHIEFVRIGQALKLEAIMRGDAPTSTSTWSASSPCTMFRKPPWEPLCFYPTFHHRGTLAGDSFGINCLFVATDDGTFLIKEDQSHYLVFDKSVLTRQLSVIEEHGLLLFRGGSISNKDGHRIHVFKLKEFQGDTILVRNRNDIKDHRLDRTRSTHLFTTSKNTAGQLKMAVAIGKKLLLYQWKYTAAYTSWCPEADPDPVTDGFIFIKEILLHDIPTIITILDGPTNTKNGALICVGFKYNFEVVCDQTGESRKVYEIDSLKRNQTQLTAAVELCDGQETELLLCFNHTCHFQKLNSDMNTNEFDFHWNTSPNQIVCAFPYIIGFTADSMEIRLLVNGNLLYSAIMPELQLITSKNDIYFTTTAPEFVTKDFPLKTIQLEAEESNESLQSRNNDNKMNVLKDTDQQLSVEAIVHINPENDLQSFLTIPSRADGVQSMQRARSLQKTRQCSEIDQKKLISKSNSYGETYGCNLNYSQITKDELNVPPNSPKIKSNIISPTKRNLKYKNPFLNSAFETNSSPERIQPLRIYKIPISNLTGSHSHFHAHNSRNTIISNAQKSYKSSSLESTNTIDIDEILTDDNNDITKDFFKITDQIENITCNCANLSLFNS